MTGFSIIKEEEYNGYVYDIEVEENHNFYANNILVHNCAISLVPKKYFLNILWKEGKTYDDIKLKVTGLDMIRSNTPKYFRKELEEVLKILITGNIQLVTDYIKKVEDKISEISPSDLCINVGVSNIDYEYFPNEKKFKALKPNGKYQTSPINSKAALTYNHFVESNNLNSPLIEAGDKIGYLYMKVPNPLIGNSNVIAFKEDSIFKHKDLHKYIDRRTMFEKTFLNSIIGNITDYLNWDLTPKEDLLSDDDW